MESREIFSLKTLLFVILHGSFLPQWVFHSRREKCDNFPSGLFLLREINSLLNDDARVDY